MAASLDPTKAAVPAGASPVVPERTSTLKGSSGLGDGASSLTSAGGQPLTQTRTARFVATLKWIAVSPYTLFKGILGWCSRKIWTPTRVLSSVKVPVERSGWFGRYVEDVSVERVLEEKIKTVDQLIADKVITADEAKKIGYSKVKVMYYPTGSLGGWIRSAFEKEVTVKRAIEEKYLTAADAVKGNHISLTDAINLKWIKIEDAIKAGILTKEQAVKQGMSKPEKPAK